MNNSSIYMPNLEDKIEFTSNNIQSLQTLSLITNGNPGSVTVMLELYRTHEDDEILLFLNKIWKHKILGARLWYIYKNECKYNIKHLLSKDLTLFTDDYFYEKFEKFI